MKCIKCGNELTPIWKGAPYASTLIKFKCPNQTCEVFGQEWLFDDNKDNQDWNVRHTKVLEQQVAKLQQLVSELTLIVQKHFEG